MLVLTRKIDQVILIGDHIRVTVLGVSGDRVKIGIEAPDDVMVMRRELLTGEPEPDDDRPDELAARRAGA